MQDISHEPPRSTSGWKLKAEQTIHADAKTVDVGLIFSAAGNP